MSIGQRIKQKRLEKNITQEQLAKMLHTTKQTIYKYENEIVNNIPSLRLEQIAVALGVTPSYLMGWEDEQKTISPKKQMLINEIEKIDDEKTLNQIKDIITVILNS